MDPTTADDDDDEIDYQPILEAAKRGYSDELEELLAQSSSDVNKPDATGNTPLIWAASGGHADAVEVLLRHGANPVATNVSGDTALHKAAWKGKIDCCDVLVKNGGAPCRLMRNKMSKLPIDVARNDDVKFVVAPPVDLGQGGGNDADSDDEGGGDD